MKKKIIKRRSFKVGMTAYFNSWYEDTKKPQELLSGEIVNVTEKFCTVNVGGTKMKKSKNNVYFSEDDLQMKILQEANELLIQKYGMDIFKLIKIYDTMSEKHPEKFV